MRINSICLSAALSLSAVLVLSNGCVTHDRVTEGTLAYAAGKPDSLKQLRDSLTFLATFDHGTNADFALGDRQLYFAPSSKERSAAKPGLPEGGMVQFAGKEGRYGDALRMTGKTKEVIFFKGEKNVAYNTTNWSGTASFWLKLDPEKDLPEGYCDPLQFVAQSWTNGVMFVEFSKDQPRHFRYGIQALPALWNPKGLKWDEIPEADRPLVVADKAPFGRDHWVHVAFTFSNANTGNKDGTGRLYLNGQFQGVFSSFNNLFQWDAAKSAVTIGLNYVGLFDDLSLFNRELTDDEVMRLYTLPGGASDILKKPYGYWPYPYRHD